MTAARLRLVAAILLFLLWVGWLSYEVVTTADPVVVSRPQILVAPVVVEARVDPEGVVQIKEVLHVDQQIEGVAVDREITVQGLQEASGWTGAGWYFLALQPVGDQAFRVVPIPASSGHHPSRNEQDSPPIYSVTPSTRLQLAEALKLREPKPDLP